VVGEPVRLLKVLRGKENRHAGAGQLGDDLPHLLPAARVQPGGRLVQEDHRRLADQARREVEPAAHPAGVGLHQPAAGVGEVEPGQ
jgi:hypothetical protein